MRKILQKLVKFIKWLFVIFIIGFIILLISIYISSLNSYNKSDFNIPKGFFDTQFGDKDPYSEENGFEDFVEFNNKLSNQENLKYFDIQSKCIFNEKYIEEGKCEVDKKIYFEKFKNKEILNILYKTYNSKSDQDKKIIQRKVRIIEDIIKSKNAKNRELVTEEDFIQYNKALKLFETEKELIIKKQLKKFKNFIKINNLKYKKINKKEYILQTPEYSAIYTGKKDYNIEEIIIYEDLILYSRAIRYISYKYMEEGKYNQGINILLNYQNFIDNLMNKTDSDLINILVYFTINRVNLEGLEYFIDNYNLPSELKFEMKLILKNKIHEGLIENAIKKEHMINRTTFKYLYDNSFNKDFDLREGGVIYYYIGIIKTLLFYSVEESEILFDKIYYDIIINNGKGSELGNSDFGLSINNYIGRILIKGVFIKYNKQYTKEKKLIKLRSDIIEKLK